MSGKTASLTRLMFCFFLALVWHPSHAQEKPLVLSNHPDQASVSLTEYFAILEDSSNNLGFDDIQQPEWAQRFTTGQPPAASLIYGFTRSAYWLRLRLHNPHSNPVERFLDINYARLANVQLYHQSPDGHVLSWTTGTDFPFATRPHPNRGFVFPLTLMTQGEHTIYIRVKGVAALEIPATLWQTDDFYAYERSDYIFYSVYTGIALAMVIFNLLVFALLRESMYALYVFFVASFALTLAAQNGLANEFLWPNSPLWSNYSMAIGYSYTLAALLLFTRSMLNTASVLPRIDRIVKTIVAIYIASPIAFFLAYQTVIPFAMLLNVVASTLILGIGIYCAIKRQRSAYFFVAAFVVICTASPINSLRVAGLLPTNLFTVNGLQIGSAIEMILLAYALADRLYTTRKEKDAAQIAALSAQQQVVETLQNSERNLEEQIQQRTQELIEKNRALELLSITDPLTGVFNRLKLNQLLRDEIERSKRYGIGLSVLMIDVDHFKAINDTYGHPAGDSVLATIAAQLRQFSRANDSPGRWGGEEFLVICPETPLDGAATLAESLRSVIEQHPFNLATPVTISIGVTQFNSDDTLESLMERVDKALYQAKQGGRNKVVIAPIDALISP
ncbi:diguanylate cyclase [Cellvibrio sp. pealriver]|uniref:sensor domain-containing diguanylate cyclase n=1 Tax=Cellvibrio sp. pealriver TaxID=1622269 RepID=UPI00066FDBBE|nr:diguanylate cyclase [Cellvibrio sp. pealriver]